MSPAACLALTRRVQLPDPLRLERCLRAPEVGPRLLFFSGGSALYHLSRELIRYTHNSIHVITTFDSGGSSAGLRQALRMPAVGDIRNRLMALADHSVRGNPEVARLFAHRLPAQDTPARLERGLREMVSGRHPLVAAVADPMRKIIRNHLRYAAEGLPPDFDLRGASIGNLVLTGGYLNNGRHLDPVIFLFSKLAEVRGVVRPVLNDNLHLAARLENGQTLVGQHLLTGRQAPPLTSPVAELFLSRRRARPQPVAAPIREKLRALVGQAELICFPMGSFYTSLLANLLPEGVCQAIAQAPCPKVFIPNPAGDPEQLGLDLAGALDRLLEYLRRGCGQEVKQDNLLNLVLVDSRAEYPGGRPDLANLRGRGLEVADVPLLEAEGQRGFHPQRLVEALVSLI